MKPLSLTLCCLCGALVYAALGAALYHHLVIAGLALALSGVVIMVLLLTDPHH